MFSLIVFAGALVAYLLIVATVPDEKWRARLQVAVIFIGIALVIAHGAIICECPERVPRPAP